ncbi:hypothetical protein DEJ44_14790 [Streptomyces venezuelae]|nr:hypothetical protein DEJ43_16085 [Streptomyces venezuelae ATCC 10712]QES10643.1 hypothetical protein DEJ44_14790 [Streptomyces venezuelae]QES14508.1 hypothetical protein DEJ45_20325 [Streptomyces venezuelae]
MERGDSRASASHVRHRRTDGAGNYLACGNIVSHHRVGAFVGCSAAGPLAEGGVIRTDVGSWNERSPLAGLSCGRTGRGSTPN